MGSKIFTRVKTDMVFNQSMTHLVDVMKNVAGAQYHVMERKRTNLKRHWEAIQEIAETYDFRAISHPFVRSANSKRLICLVTSDFGFLGGLNMKVIQEGLKYQTNETHYLVFGERGLSYLKEFGLSYTFFPSVEADESRFDLASEVKNEILKLALRDGYGEAMMVYPHAVSMTVQRVEALQLIPCPIFYHHRPEKVLTQEEQEKDVVWEAAEKEIIEALVAVWMRHHLVELFEDAKLAEYGARMMHLEESYQTLTKQSKQLRLEYFKIRREKIDQSLRETFSSRLLLQEE